MLSRIIQFEGGESRERVEAPHRGVGICTLQGFPEVSQEVVKGEGSCLPRQSGAIMASMVVCATKLLSFFQYTEHHQYVN